MLSAPLMGQRRQRIYVSICLMEKIWDLTRATTPTTRMICGRMPGATSATKYSTKKANGMTSLKNSLI